MNVRADTALFDRWRSLALHIESLKSAVQNDVEITQKECDEWMALTRKIGMTYNNLVADTYKHLTKSKKVGRGQG